jgi:hypothetical protein
LLPSTRQPAAEAAAGDRWFVAKDSKLGDPN